MSTARSIPRLNLATLAMIAMGAVGCASKSKQPIQQVVGRPLGGEFIPQSAELVAQGGTPVRFTANTAGTLYAYNRDERRIVLQYDLSANETFTLAPSATTAPSFGADRHGAAGAGKLPVSRTGYEIYFLKKGPPASNPPATARSR